jgi:branched-chain amino acid transport system substrate-binding protein
MKHIVRYVTVLVVLASLLLAACVGVATPAPTEAPAPAEPAATEAPTEVSPIKIGVSLPLTGDFSEPGDAARKGYEVWVDVVNGAGGLLGRPVELTVLDNASDPDTAVAGYERLITVDKVDLVVGPFSSRLVIPTSEVAAKYGYAFPEPAGGAPDVFNRGLNNIFFCQPAPSAQQGISFVEYVLSLPDDQQPKTFAVASQDDPFTLGVVGAMKEMLQEAGMELVFDEIYPPGTTDFSSIAIQLADLDPDLVLGGTMFEDSVGQIRAYQEAGYQPRGAFFSTGPSLPAEFKEALGDATEGVFAAISWFEDSVAPTNPEFVAAYHAKFGDEPVAEDSANAFTVGQVLQQAIEATGTVDNATLIDYMHKATFTTNVGQLSFDEAGRPKGRYLTLQWQGDMYTIVAPEDAKMAEAVWPKPEW